MPRKYWMVFIVIVIVILINVIAINKRPTEKHNQFIMGQVEQKDKKFDVREIKNLMQIIISKNKAERSNKELDSLERRFKYLSKKSPSIESDSTKELLNFIEWRNNKKYIDVFLALNDEDYIQLLNNNYRPFQKLYKELYNGILYKERLNKNKYLKREKIDYSIVKEKRGGGTWTRCDMTVSLNRYINEKELKTISNSIRNDGRKSFDNLCIHYRGNLSVNQNYAFAQYLKKAGKWGSLNLYGFSKCHIKNIIKRERICWDSLINEGYKIIGKWTDGNDMNVFIRKDSKLFVNMKLIDMGRTLISWGTHELYPYKNNNLYMYTEHYIIQNNILFHYSNSGKDVIKYTEQISGKCGTHLGKWKDNSHTITLRKNSVSSTRYEGSDKLISDKSDPQKFIVISRIFKRHKDGSLSYSCSSMPGSTEKFRAYGELETMWIN